MNLSDHSEQTSKPVADGMQGRARKLAMAVIVCGLTICVLDSTMLSLALPQMARQWSLDPAYTLWVVNANQIASLVLLLPLAALGDRLGYKRVYLWGMLVFGLASVLAALAPSLAWLIAARALQGMGMAGALCVNGALVRQIYPRSMLGQGMALNSMVVALSYVMGPVLAAAVLSQLDWRWLFSLHLPLALWVCWLGMKALPQPSQASNAHGLSWLDVALNVTMFGAIFLALDRLSHYQVGEGLLWAVVWLVIGVASGGLYVHRQKRQAEPMLPLDLLRIPVFRLSMCASICAFSAQTIAFLALPFLLIETHGVSIGQTGLLISAWPLALAVVAPVVGRKIGRIPASRLGAMGMTLFATGLVALAAVPVGAMTWDMAWRLALCGAGFAMFQSPNNHTIVTSAPMHRSGAASGMLGTARHVGQGLGAICLAAAFVLWPGTEGVAEQRAMWLAGGLALLAAGFSGLRQIPARQSIA
jgi:MFS transporter, DHA2 family, multidrug resistance protein